MTQQIQTTSFTGQVNLADARLGARTVAASDEYFAEASNMLKPERAVFLPEKFTDHGKWMDGWESRRKREQGYDWAIVELGLPGVVRGFDIDTAHFLGNHAPYGAVEGTYAPGASAEALRDADWQPVLFQQPLRPGAQNLFVADQPSCCTHLRLVIHPDGGVARFRALGTVDPQWASREIDGAPRVDLVAIENGGRALACSDSFFSPMNNLILPHPPENMGEGWESRRRRGPGHDWVLLRLGAVGRIHGVDIDTKFFKGNFPDTVSLEAVHVPGDAVRGTFQTTDLLSTETEWKPLLASTPLAADKNHLFRAELQDVGPVNHVRLNVFPDGGVARLRLWGERVGS